jgi:hypothetical protein
MLRRIVAAEEILDSTESELLDASPFTPYVCYWAPGTAYEESVYFRIKRNKHLTIVVPGRDEHFCLNFNYMVDRMV